MRGGAVAVGYEAPNALHRLVSEHSNGGRTQYFASRLLHSAAGTLRLVCISSTKPPSRVPHVRTLPRFPRRIRRHARHR